MMSLSAIKSANAEVKDRAKLLKLQPANFSKVDIVGMKAGDLSKLGNIPSIGEYDPPYFKRVSLDELEEADSRGVFMGDNGGYGAYFVDSTGFGRGYEPALTIAEFVEKIRPEYAYAIVEEGQFQIKIGVFSYSV